MVRRDLAGTLTRVLHARRFVRCVKCCASCNENAPRESASSQADGVSRASQAVGCRPRPHRRTQIFGQSSWEAGKRLGDGGFGSKSGAGAATAWCPRTEFFPCTNFKNLRNQRQPVSERDFGPPCDWRLINTMRLNENAVPSAGGAVVFH